MHLTPAVKFALGLLGLASLVMLGAPPAAAQADVRGQILFPDGDLPSEPIRYSLTRDDGQVNELGFTDSNGRFVLPRLSDKISYTLSVNGDGSTYGNTTYSFVPTHLMHIRVTLNPPPRRSNSPRSAPRFAVSAASGYKPASRAAALYERGMKEVEKKRYDAAEGLLRQAAAADPKFLAPWNDLGVVLMQKGKYAEAEKVLRQALAADSKSIHALLNLGITLNHLGRFADAQSPLREGLRLEPGLVAGHAQLGVALVETDQFSDAEKELTRAAKSAGAQEVVVQLYLGKLYARTGDFERSVAALHSYLRLVPHAANAAEVRELIQRMQALRAQGR